MGKNFDEIIKKYRQQLSKDESIEKAIDDLYANGFTITDAMKVLRLFYGISLGDAKKIVTAHPVWSLVVRAHEPFHEELEKFAEAWSNDRLTNFDMPNSGDVKNNSGNES